MQAAVVVVLLLVAVASCQYHYNQSNLYSFTADGFDTVLLDDMSFVNEINYQSFDNNNISFYIYGESRLRTVYPGESFYVGSTPNENWGLPFIDFHTFMNGSDVWGIGPINALGSHNRSYANGFQFEIAIVTTKTIPGVVRNRIFVNQPLGFEGTFYSVRVVGFDINNVIGYFCGFFPAADGSLNFGVRRAHFNTSLFQGNAWNSSNDAWYFNSTIDDGVVASGVELVTYNPYFKPFMLHARNVSANAPPNSTWLVVVDPYSNHAYLIMANYDPTVPLNYTNRIYIPTWNNVQLGNIVSAVIWQSTLFVGVSVQGMGTGWIDVVNLSDLSLITQIQLPTNYSDPRALVMDYTEPNTPTIYIGMNGGAAVLKLDINTLSITAYQPLPFYLHRVWRGIATRYHIYFVTNEQHPKVFRVAKEDLCDSMCMQNGYCSNGKCVCGTNFVQNGDQCEWKSYVHERTLERRNKGGEVALGVLFALTFVAAAVGWYFVWRNRRGYSPV